MNDPRRVNILIVEDELLLAEDSKERLELMGHNVVAYVPSVKKALEQLKEHPEINMVLIDIRLKGELDGIELAKMINVEYKIPFIFLTAYADWYLVERAKQVRPFNYMLKPFNDQEMAINIEMAMAQFDRTQSYDSGDGPGSTPQEEDDSVLHFNDSLFLKKDNHYQRVALADITVLEADNNYTRVYTTHGKYLYSTVLKRVEEKLPDNYFLRVHRSYIVNINSVDGFGDNMLDVSGKRIPVSKQYRAKVFEIFSG